MKIDFENYLFNMIFLPGVLEKHLNEKILVVSRQKYIDLETKENLTELTKPYNVQLAWYDSIAGSNEYIESDVCILYGSPYLPPDEAKRTAYFFETPSDVFYRNYTEGDY